MHELLKYTVTQTPRQQLVSLLQLFCSLLFVRGGPSSVLQS